MAIINEQLKMSEVFVADGKFEAQELGLGESVLINFPRVEEGRSGYYFDYQYPDNSQVFDGDNVVARENGLEIINNSKTAAVLG